MMMRLWPVVSMYILSFNRSYISVREDNLNKREDSMTEVGI
jgi:hypothetical protein